MSTLPTLALVAVLAMPGLADQLLSLEFHGGSIESYVDAVREHAAEPVNIIVTQRAAELPSEAVELREVSVRSAMALLDNRRLEIGAVRFETKVDYIVVTAPTRTLERQR